MVMKTENSPATNITAVTGTDNTTGSESSLPIQTESEKQDTQKELAASSETDDQVETLVVAATTPNEPTVAATPTTTTEPSPQPSPETKPAPTVSAAPAAEASAAQYVAPQEEAAADWENDGQASLGSVAYSFGRGLGKPLLACVYPLENAKNTALIVGGTLAVCAAFPPAAPVVGAVLTAAAIGWGLWSAFKAVSATVTAYNTGNWDNLEKGMEAAGQATLAASPFALGRIAGGAASLLSRTERGAAIVSKVAGLAPKEGSGLANALQGMQKGSDYVTTGVGKVVNPIVKTPINIAGSTAGALKGGVSGALDGAKTGVRGNTVFKKPATETTTVTQSAATSAEAEAAIAQEANAVKAAQADEASGLISAADEADEAGKVADIAVSA